MKISSIRHRTAVKRSAAVFLLCAVLLSGCALQSTQKKRYTETFVSVFDTVTTVTGHAESEDAFREAVAYVKDGLEHYHRLFDIYNEYEGVNNLKTLNDRAALEPLKVDMSIIELLEDCREFYTLSGGVFNPAMGGVLSLWHKAREDGIADPQNAYLPSRDALAEAARHSDPESIVIDRERSTVFFSDPELKLDVGGAAKGWAVQRVCENAPEGLLVNVGGNVYATGPKTEDGEPWAVGIQDPKNEEGYLHILNITYGSVVTGGSYQRTYTVDGKEYHHIIDPNTLYPAELWESVSVVADDSGMADMLSTALFLLDRQAGQELLDRFSARAMWADKEGNKYYSTGFEELIKS